MCAFTNPLFVTSVYFTQFFSLNNTYCRIVGFLYVTSMSMEDWLNLSLAINRSVALLYPTFYPRLTKKWGTIGMVALGWTGVIPYSVALIGVTASFEPAPPWGACSLRPLPQFVPLYTFDLAFPLISAGLMYMMTFIVYKIRTSRQVSVKGTGQNALSPVSDRHVRIIKMLFASYLWYLIFFLPSTLLAYVFIEYARSSVTATFYGRASTLFAFATNPVRYSDSQVYYLDDFYLLKLKLTVLLDQIKNTGVW